MPTSLPSWNAAALAVVVLALGRAARSHGVGRLTGATEVAGLAAAGLSLVQCALGLLAGRVAPGGDSSAVGSIFELVSRIDGAKILLLVVAVSAIALARQVGTLPAWPVYL